MASLSLTAHLGVVTSRDPSLLANGELQEATACEYHPGSVELHKQPGRALVANLGTDSTVRALNKCQYDSASDTLVAVAGGKVFESLATTAPSFGTAVLTGLTETANPQFTGFQDRWIMCNGIDGNYVREAATTVTGSNWRPLGLTAPPVAPTYTAIASGSSAIKPSSNSGGYVDPTRAYDTDPTTYSDTFARGTGGFSHTFTFSTNLTTGAGHRILYIDHEASSSSVVHGPANPKFDVVDTDGNPNITTIEYSVDSGATYTVLGSFTGGISRTTLTKSLDDSLDFSLAGTHLVVRVTTFGSGAHKIYDIRISRGASTPYTLLYAALEYRVVEEYIDSNLESHVSNSSPPATVLVADVSAKYGIILSLPARANNHSTYFRIYRSVDTPGGGYPNLYNIATIAATETQWIDDFEILPSTTPDKPFLPIYEVLYPTNETILYEPNGKPPVSSLSIPFQGSMVYVPTSTLQTHWLFYSIPVGIGTASMESVPAFQYLEFQSPKNDTIVSACTTQGGNSLLAFFESYTMIVNRLPQSGDGAFENKVKEYVSNTRGCAGPLACCEFTLPTGSTLVASVDSLGLWVTNGVSVAEEWSRDLDWNTLMGGVDLSTARLVDNPSMRRLELLYTDALGQKKELTWFYERMKTDGSGKSAPLALGPTPSGVEVKHYTRASSAWVGFSGSYQAEGNIFVERASYTDDSHGYDSLGTVPWSFTLPDIYVPERGTAHVLEIGGPSFTSAPNKVITVSTTFYRDRGFQHNRVKTFNSGGTQNIYWHQYCDRHRTQLLDLTATAAPSFISYEIEANPCGPARDR